MNRAEEGTSDFKRAGTWESMMLSSFLINSIAFREVAMHALYFYIIVWKVSWIIISKTFMSHWLTWSWLVSAPCRHTESSPQKTLRKQLKWCDNSTCRPVGSLCPVITVQICPAFFSSSKNALGKTCFVYVWGKIISWWIFEVVSRLPVVSYSSGLRVDSYRFEI